MSDWQPIATAPKDGTDLVVMCGPGHDPMYAIASWDDGEASIRGVKQGWLMWWLEPIQYADWAEYWMPLPEPPAP